MQNQRRLVRPLHSVVMCPPFVRLGSVDLPSKPWDDGLTIQGRETCLAKRRIEIRHACIPSIARSNASQARVISGYGATLSGRHVVRRVKAKGRQITKCTQHLAVVRRSQCLTGILDDGEIVSAGERRHLLHIDRVAQDMSEEDGTVGDVEEEMTRQRTPQRSRQSQGYTSTNIYRAAAKRKQQRREQGM